MGGPTLSNLRSHVWETHYCFQCRGISELIGKWEIGYLLDVLDVNKAVDLIKGLIDSKETMTIFGEKGQKVAYQYFSKERMIEEYRNIYEGIGYV